MPRENSPFVLGDYWLDKRRDGRSPDVWQIASYNAGTRAIVYRSTKQRALDAAIAALRSFDAELQSKQPNQAPEDAPILPHLFNYLREQGPDVKRLDTVKSSHRAWIGFLMQDELGTGARVADIGKNFINRFRRWRMGPHSWAIMWGDEMFEHESEGVSAKTVQRNIEDLRAALHHAEANKRFVAPKVISVDKKLIKKNPREVYDLDTLGAIIGFARAHDKGLYRELCLQLASGCRPGHAIKFDPAEQWHGDIMDLQPWREDETDKRAAVVPVIDRLRPILADWKQSPHDPVKSRKRTWRTMRRALGLRVGADAYAIRTTVATFLDTQGTPGAEISGIIGHLPESRGIARTTSKHYLAYDPRTCDRAKEVLTELFDAVLQRSEKWSAVHLLSTPLRGKPLKVLDRAEEMAENCA